MNTILILDDEDAIRQSLVDFFEDNLWNPISVNSAEDALEILNQSLSNPIAAIIDIRLPGMNGAEFVRTIHQQGVKMVCVFCTGSPEFRIPADLESIPAISNRLFKKPIANLSELKQEIENTLALSGIEIDNR